MLHMLFRRPKKGWSPYRGWLDDDPDDDSNDSSFQQNDSSCCQREMRRDGEGSGNASRNEGMYLNGYTHVQQNERTESRGEETFGSSSGVCVSRPAVIQNENATYCGSTGENTSIIAPLDDSICRQRAVTCCHSPPPVNPTEYIALPVAKDEPCHICGRRPTSRVLRGGGVYLCYDCLIIAKRPSRARPLPGVLERSAENL